MWGGWSVVLHRSQVESLDAFQLVIIAVRNPAFDDGSSWSVLDWQNHGIDWGELSSFLACCCVVLGYLEEKLELWMLRLISPLQSEMLSAVRISSAWCVVPCQWHKQKFLLLTPFSGTRTGTGVWNRPLGILILPALLEIYAVIHFGVVLLAVDRCMQFLDSNRIYSRYV